MSILIFEAGIGGLNMKSTSSLLLIGIAPLAVTTLVVYRLSGETLDRGIAILASLLCVALLAGGFWQMAVPRISLRADSLETGGGLYRIAVPLREIDLSCAAVIGRGEFEKVMGRRNNGIELPGLALGWFQSKEGQLFAAIGSAREVLLLPTRRGYTIATTPDEPEGILGQLRAAAARDAGERQQPPTRADSCSKPDQRM